MYYGRNTRVKQQFCPNEKVLIRSDDDKIWEPACVVSKHKTPRSYWVNNKKGNVVRRNSVFMRKRFVNQQVNPSYDDSEVTWVDESPRVSCKKITPKAPPNTPSTPQNNPNVNSQTSLSNRTRMNQNDEDNVRSR